MRKYACDIYGYNKRCEKVPTIAYDDGEELHFRCEVHRSLYSGKCMNAFRIEGDAMEECPINAQNSPQTIMEAVTAETLRDTAKRLIAARDERLKDRLIMHALGVRWTE